jgi:hypothetical protein
VIRSTRWAISSLDCAVHLLVSEGDEPLGVLQARCGHLLPTVVHQLDQPPPGPPCEDCRLIFLADCALHAAAAQLAVATAERAEWRQRCVTIHDRSVTPRPAAWPRGRATGAVWTGQSRS